MNYKLSTQLSRQLYYPHHQFYAQLVLPDKLYLQLWTQLNAQLARQFISTFKGDSL